MFRLVLVVSCLLAGGVRAGDEPIVAYGTPVEQGRLQNPALREASGLAASRRNAGVLWTVNDSGNEPFVYAVGPHGEDVGAWRIAGVGRGDWEDVATARLGSTHVLVIGDIGDNDRSRPQRLLYLVAEPAIPPGARRLRGELQVLRTVRYRYPDGSHDCEALAVEPDASGALLVTKTLLGSGTVYAVGLGEERGLRVATPVGAAPANLVTGAALSPDGTLLVIGTYTSAYLYRRAPGEAWAAVLARTPQHLLLPPRPQGEGVTFAADGRSLLAGSEGVRSPLWLVPAAPGGVTPP